MAMSSAAGFERAHASVRDLAERMCTFLSMCAFSCAMVTRLLVAEVHKADRDGEGSRFHLEPAVVGCSVQASEQEYLLIESKIISWTR